MSLLSGFALRVKRKEGPFYAVLYRYAKAARGLSMPSIRWGHLPLYHLDCSVRASVGFLYQALWAVPLFRARCEESGRNIRLPNGIPYIYGSHLRIFVGDGAKILRTTIGASKVFDRPVLRIGNYSTVGYGTTISVSREVVIGDHVLIGPNCLIMDSDDHPVHPAKRLAGEPVAPEDIHPVRIGDNVWIGNGCSILKGVTIGENSVIASNSVVTKDVLPNCVYAGYPARPVVRDIDKV